MGLALHDAMCSVCSWGCKHVCVFAYECVYLNGVYVCVLCLWMRVCVCLWMRVCVWVCTNVCICVHVFVNACEPQCVWAAYNQWCQQIKKQYATSVFNKVRLSEAEGGHLACQIKEPIPHIRCLNWKLYGQPMALFILRNLEIASSDGVQSWCRPTHHTPAQTCSWFPPAFDSQRAATASCLTSLHEGGAVCILGEHMRRIARQWEHHDCIMYDVTAWRGRVRSRRTCVPDS